MEMNENTPISQPEIPLAPPVQPSAADTAQQGAIDPLAAAAKLDGITGQTVNEHLADPTVSKRRGRKPKDWIANLNPFKKDESQTAPNTLENPVATVNPAGIATSDEVSERMVLEGVVATLDNTAKAILLLVGSIGKAEQEVIDKAIKVCTIQPPTKALLVEGGLGVAKKHGKSLRNMPEYLLGMGFVTWSVQLGGAAYILIEDKKAKQKVIPLAQPVKN